jgi:hypothetical protein
LFRNANSTAAGGALRGRKTRIHRRVSEDAEKRKTVTTNEHE